VTARKVILRNTSDADGPRYLGARITDVGDLRLEGQDLGPGVERVFGEGLTEYEWLFTVLAEHLEDAVVALGGDPGADPLTVVEAFFASGRGHEFGPVLRDAGVPVEFWSRVGD
jgi:hypothetical protein